MVKAQMFKLYQFSKKYFKLNILHNLKFMINTVIKNEVDEISVIIRKYIPEEVPEYLKILKRFNLFWC